MSPHGTEDRYVNGDCRCDACRAAATRGRKIRRHVTRDQADPLSLSVVGSRRRLQALMCVGWSLPRLEKEANVRPGLFVQITKRGERVHRRTADAISALYNRLWDQEPPAMTPGEMHSVSYTRTVAKRNGYAPPMAWDDESIDNPDATPRLDAEGRAVDWVKIARAMEGDVDVRLTPAEKWAGARYMRDSGHSRTHAAKRLHMSGSQVKYAWQEAA